MSGMVYSMSFEQIINSGLDRAELTDSRVLITPKEKKYSITVRDLTSGDKWLFNWELAICENESMSEEDIAYMMLRLANESLEELRSED